MAQERVAQEIIVSLEPHQVPSTGKVLARHICLQYPGIAPPLMHVEPRSRKLLLILPNSLREKFETDPAAINPFLHLWQRWGFSTDSRRCNLRPSVIS